MQSTHPGLRAVCEAAARALRCDVHGLLMEPDGGRECHIVFDPRAGDVAEDASAAVPGRREAELTMPFAQGRGVLRWTRANAEEWSREEHALAEALAAVAELACGGSPLPDADPQTAASGARADEELERRVQARTAELAAANETLRASEEHFRRLIEHAHDLIVIVDDEGRPLYGSPAASRVLGFDPAEVDGSSLVPPYHPDDVERVAAWLQELSRDCGTTHRIEYRFRHRQGHWLYLEAVCAVPADHRPGSGHVINIRDITERRQAEEELRRTEERYRALIENGNDLVMISAPDGTLTYVSPSVSRLLGYAPREMLALRPDELLHPGDVAATMESIGRILAVPGVAHRANWRIRHRDGSWREFEAIGRTLDSESSADGIVINGRDVTQQRAAELALQRSEEHFRRLIEHSYDLVQVLDGEGRIVYTGPSVTRLLGYTPDEIAGGGLADFMHPDDLPAAASLVARLLAEPGVSGSLEYRVRHRDGSWRWLEAFARTLSPTSPDEGIVANARDITERLEAQHALRQSEEHFRQLIENGSDLLLIATPDEALTYVSPSVERILGFSPAEIPGWTLADLVHPDDRAALWDATLDMGHRQGAVRQATWRARHRDGGWRLMESFGRTLTLHSGELRFMANARDVTERYRAEVALRQATAEAERANRAKSEFLSRMSHELRTPLNSILGFAQVLEDVELAPEYRTGVRHILNGGRHLLSLINEVLDIARIEADQQALSLEPVRLGAVVREAVDMVCPLAAAREVTVVEEAGPASERYVHADRQRLAQVLLNLLSNAVKYNRPRGRVWISCAAFRGDDGVEWLAARVRDEGEGIAAEHRDRLFHPFERLGAEHTGIEGTGLGLALSRHLAHAMGGALALERTGAEGSVFRVELHPAPDPLADAGAIVAKSQASGPASGGTATLLYVEDNLANLSLVETILLPRQGWRLIPALQGRLGLELAAEHAPDVVLLDLHLPDLPGREVLRLLRADPRTARTPVVVISADATPRTVQALLAEGANAFLAKPLDVRAFLATVERLLAPHRSHP